MSPLVPVILLFMLLVVSGDPPVIAYDEVLDSSGVMYADDAYGFGEMPHTPWRAEGTATTSLIATLLAEDSDTEETIFILSTSEPVSGIFEALPGLITVDLTGQVETLLTISGLLPDTTYHQYVDSYESHTEVLTDAEGSYSFTIDLADPHVIFIQPHKSTYFLKSDATGGDCEGRDIGIWDATTKTCTLTTDITETVQIGSNWDGVSDGITLDGAGYNLSTGSQGVYIYKASNIVVKNLSIENCSKALFVDSTNLDSGITLSNITTYKNITGLDVRRVGNVVVHDGSFEDEQNGINFNQVNGLSIENVDVTLIEPYLFGNQGDSGISISGTTQAYVRNVSLSGSWRGLYLKNSIDGDLRDISITNATHPISVWFEDDPVYMNNEIRAQVDGAAYVFTSNKSNVTIDASLEPASALVCAFCTNTTITGYTFDHPKIGVILYRADGVVIENSVFKGSGGHGVQTINSSGVVIRNNDIYPVKYAPLYFSNPSVDAVPSEVYHNNIYKGVGTQQYALVSNMEHIFSLPLPIGGNWWERYDEPNEGCVDENDDKICDAPYSIPPTQPYSKIDQYPWTSPNAWESAPSNGSLILPTDAEYSTDGLHPNKGIANEDGLTFKVVHTGDTPPSSVDLTVTQVVTFDTEYFMQPPYVSESDAEHLHRGSRYDLPDTVLGYEGLLGYRPGFDKGESLEFTPEGRARYEASVDFYVTRVSGGLGSEYLTVALEALDAEGVVVVTSEKTVDVSDIPDHTSVLETLTTTSDSSNIASVRFVVTDASFSILFDAEAWINSFTLKEKVPMSLDSTEGTGEVYSITSTFPKGKYSYFFTAKQAEGLTLRYPETNDLPFTTGYSSIAFLHGIESSRLYDGDNKVWLPNRGSGGGTSAEGDIKKTAFTDAGESSYDLHTKDEDILNTAYGVNNIYEDFSIYMDMLENNGAIKAWKPIAYDWRLDYFDLVAKGVKRNDADISYLDPLPSSATPFIIAEIQKLAEASDSGQVTIITHSNGGLVAKALLSELEKGDNPHHELYAKVDKLVMVAAPQLGTPLAYLSMLHGIGHPFEGWRGGIPAGFFSNIDQAWRFASRNMPMAYSLLPSRTYTELMKDSPENRLFVFDASLDKLAPTISARTNGYEGATLGMAFDYRNGKEGTVSVTDYDEYVNFLLGNRPKPPYEDVRYPMSLASELLERAEVVHAQIDTWMPSESDIKVIQIAGWGNNTVSGIQYESEDDVHFACNQKLSACHGFPGVHAVPLLTTHGDETVVLQSAVPMPVETWYVDLYKYNSKDAQKTHGDSNRIHSNIMGAQPTLSLLDNIITIRSKENIPYVSKNIPTGAHIVQLEMHSPVSMHVYDNEGNHTGLVTDVDGVTYFEENIPGSSMMRFGESVYISLVADEVYQVQLEGVGKGTFTFKIKEKIDDVPVDELLYEDVPVNESTLGSMLVGTIASAESLIIDYDGDGATDFTLGALGNISPLEYLNMLEVSVSEMNLARPIKNSILGRCKALHALLKVQEHLPIKNIKAREQIKKLIVKMLTNLDTTVQYLIKKELMQDEDGKIIHRLIENIRDNAVKY